MNTATMLPHQTEFDAPHDPLLLATMELERYAKLLDLEDWIVERLRHCEQEMFVNFLVTADDGRAHPAMGIFARHCVAGGPAAVPLRVSRDIYRNSVCAEAMRMSWLCALYEVRYGGGAAAVVVDPAKQSERELQASVKGFAAAAKESLGSAGLLFPAGIHAVEMDWLESGLPEDRHAVLTGKTSAPSTETRAKELARGWAELIRCVTGSLKQKVAVQGFDDSMRELLTHLHDKGAHIVAVADESGGLSHELGLDPKQLSQHMRNYGVLLGYTDAEATLNADVLESECDVLVLAGGEQQITATNAEKVRASVVLEITPGAVAPAAVKMLEGKNLVRELITSGPALLLAVAEANGIGSEKRRSAWVRRMLRDTWHSISETARRWNISVSEAAYALAIQRVAAILRAQKARS